MKSKGFGDTVASIAKSLNIPHCPGCEERRKLLNKLFPYAKEYQKETKDELE